MKQLVKNIFDTRIFSQQAHYEDASRWYDLPGYR